MIKSKTSMLGVILATIIVTIMIIFFSEANSGWYELPLMLQFRNNLISR